MCGMNLGRAREHPEIQPQSWHAPGLGVRLGFESALPSAFLCGLGWALSCLLWALSPFLF